MDENNTHTPAHTRETPSLASPRNNNKGNAVAHECRRRGLRKRTDRKEKERMTSNTGTPMCTDKPGNPMHSERSMPLQERWQQQEPQPRNDMDRPPPSVQGDAEFPGPLLVARFGSAEQCDEDDDDTFTRWMRRFVQNSEVSRPSREYEELKGIADRVMDAWVRKRHGTFVLHDRPCPPRHLFPSDPKHRELLSRIIQRKVTRLTEEENHTRVEETNRDNDDSNNQDTRSTPQSSQLRVEDFASSSSSPSPRTTTTTTTSRCGRPPTLVAKFGNPSNRMSRDVFMQWLTPWVSEYATTKKHTDKEFVVDRLIAQWIQRNGVFMLYQRHSSSSSSSSTTQRYRPLLVTDPADRETIGYYTKQKLSKLAAKKNAQPRYEAKRKPKLDLLVAMLSQDSPPPPLQTKVGGVS